MKNLFPRDLPKRHTGFTLVELLVVIAIIAILAGVTLSISGTVIRIAKRTKSQNTATQIQTAVLSYYTEYSVYPTPSGTTVATDYELTDTDGSSGGPSANSWGPLIQCLSGNISPSAGTGTTTVFSNTRSIAYLTLKATDVSSTSPHVDAPLNPLPPVSGNLYFDIALDTDYDGILGANPSAISNMPNFGSTFSAAGGGSTTAGVAVWANCNSVANVNSAAWYVHTY